MFIAGGKIIYLQTIKGNENYNKSIQQAINGTTITRSARGNIYDANSLLIAVDIPAKTIYAVPHEIKDKSVASNQMSAILGISSNEILKNLNSNNNFVYIKRQADQSTSDKILSLKIDGIYYTNETKRFYTNSPTLSKILGFVSVDGKGLSGIEDSMNEKLTGTNGKVTAKEDLFNKTTITSSQSIDGQDITLTIDSVVQTLAQEVLKKTVTNLKAKSATFLLMNPNNGNILAMADYPSYDNNNYQKSNSTQWLNNSVSLVYEPGSVFKTLTASIAINEGLTSPTEMFNDPGTYTFKNGIGSATIRNYHGKSYGMVSFTRAIGYSSNVIAVKVGQRIPTKTYLEYLKNFGAGKTTGVELPAESNGLIQSIEEIKKPIVKANMCIGQGIAVTPLQIIKIVSEIVNGGYKIQPHIISKIGDKETNSETTNKEQVITEETSEKMRTILTEEVLTGSGKKANINGYNIGGKTGTAQVAENGHYASDKYIVSFVGFVPSDNPQLIGLVVINQPKDTSLSGGSTAAPIWKEIMTEVLKRYNLSPQIANPELNLN